MEKEIEDRFKALEKRIENIEHLPSKIESSGNNLEHEIIQKIDEIGVQHLVLLALRLKSKQPRNDLKLKIESWNKPVGTWFGGGHLKNRLLKTHQIIHDGINKDNEELYSLGSKGAKTVKNLIEKYKLQ